MESIWSPLGFYTKLYIVVFSIWSPGGVHMESVGEGKVHRVGCDLTPDQRIYNYHVSKVCPFEF